MKDEDFTVLMQQYTLMPLREVQAKYPTVLWNGSLRLCVVLLHNGDIYDGEWEVSHITAECSFKLHGCGVYFSTFEHWYYVGAMHQNTFHGQGQRIWLASSVVWRNNYDPNSISFGGRPFAYQGAFKYGSRHGPAHCAFKHGFVKHTIWSHDNLVYASAAIYGASNPAPIKLTSQSVNETSSHKLIIYPTIVTFTPHASPRSAINEPDTKLPTLHAGPKANTRYQHV